MQAKQLDAALGQQMGALQVRTAPAALQAAMPSLAVLRARELQRWAGSREYASLVPKA